MAGEQRISRFVFGYPFHVGRYTWGLPVAVVLLVANAAVTHASDSPDVTTTSPGQVALLGDANPDEAGDVIENWLLGVQAGAARTVPMNTSPDGLERFRLVLRDVAPVTMFSDRPLRESRLISPKALVSNWETWFAGDPPNALISVPRPDLAPESFVVTLTDPKWNHRAKKVILTATRELVKHDPQSKGTTWKRPKTPREIESVSIFIDNSCLFTCSTSNDREAAPGSHLSRPQKGPAPPRDSGIRPPLSLPSMRATYMP